MDGRQSDYSQSGLSSPYPSYSEPHSEGSSADQGSAAQYSQQSQDSRSATFSSSATPTSEYGLNPSSARSGNFPEYIQRGAHYQQSNTPSANTGQMAQTNPSIAATSPTYSQHQQYSPYAPPPDMAHHAQYQGPPIYPPRGNEWPGGHYNGPPMHYGHAPGSSGPPQPSMQSPVPRPPPAGGHPLSTVYSFVPIPGAQQHKRPRRRYEEIERMYKCGWQGCEKAYGTLNHLNAHVTMQSHGVKRTPEEFKEIRKEWKQKKKEEEASRKADDERARADGRNAPEHPSENPAYGNIRQQMPGGMGGPQLPPIGYAPAAGGQPAQYATQSPGMDGMPHFPQSPYTPNHPMYQQNPENPPSNYQS